MARRRMKAEPGTAAYLNEMFKKESRKKTPKKFTIRAPSQTDYQYDEMGVGGVHEDERVVCGKYNSYLVKK